MKFFIFCILSLAVDCLQMWRRKQTAFNEIKTWWLRRPARLFARNWPTGSGPLFAEFDPIVTEYADSSSRGRRDLREDLERRVFRFYSDGTILAFFEEYEGFLQRGILLEDLSELAQPEFPEFLHYVGPSTSSTKLAKFVPRPVRAH